MFNRCIESLLKAWVVCLILFGGSMLLAQSVTDSMWSFSFDAPQGWQYQKDMNGATLGHNTVPGLILLFPHELKTISELKIQMQQGLNEDEGYLQLQGKLHTMGKNTLVGDYTGIYQMQQVKAKGYGTFSPYSGGAFVIAMSTPQSYSSQLLAAGKAIVKSIRYKKIDNSKRTNNTRMSEYFVGKWSTYTKYSETHIYFYPNGTYVSTNSSSYGNSDASMGATWGMAGDNNNRGSWQVQGNMKSGRITLTAQNGEHSYIDYRIQGPEMYFNGTLYGYSSQWYLHIVWRVVYASVDWCHII